MSCKAGSTNNWWLRSPNLNNTNNARNVNNSGNINNIAIYGQDSNPTTWKMAQMNLAIRGIEPDLGSYAADTFLDDRHPTMRADFVMANNWSPDEAVKEAA